MRPTRPMPRAPCSTTSIAAPGARICARSSGVPMGMLPEVRDSAGDFGETLPDLLGVSVPIRGVAGDQQAATTGQACFKPGMVKATYGTGCFALLVTGNQSVRSRNRLLTTVGAAAERPAQLCAGRVDLRGRCRSAVAARRAWADRDLRPDRGAGGRGRSGAERLSGAGLHRSRRAALGCRCPWCDVRPDPGHRPARDCARGAGFGRLSDPRSGRGDAR